MITLHESNITSFPQDNGIGVLKDVIRAYAEEELNGLFEFYMEYDSEGHLVDELKEERIIKAKAQDKLGYQLFRIYSITKNHDNDNLIIRAQHITYDLADNFVEKLEANNLTKKQVMELIGSSTVLPHPFNITSSNTTTRSSTRLYRTNPLQMIGGIEGSVLQIWGGQIERDNFNLILHDRRGSDDGVKVTYEKNITGLEATFDISGLVTRIFPFVYIEATDDEPARLITVSGKYIDSPHINDYEKIYIRPIDYTHDERIDLNGTDAQIRQQLTNIASQYFTETGNDKIKVDMEVQFEHLWETEEYKDLAVLELVGMGDTVTIEHSRLKVDATAIVNYIRYDCIAEKNEEVRLGSVKARLTDNVNKTLDVVKKVEQAQQTANQAIRAANGKNTIYYGPDEPEGGIEGDLWFRVVDGEYTRTYRHDGIQWQLVLSVDVRDAIDEAQQAKDDAQSAVDTANQAFNNVDVLSTMVNENTGEISTIKQDVIGLQTTVGNLEDDVQTQFTQLQDNLNLRVMKGDVINQINISDESILIDGKRIHITGQTTIDNGVIKSAHIESLDAGKITTGVLDAAQVTLINLVGLDIYGSRFRSETGTDFMEITGGNIRLQQANGRFVEINPSGFYGYNSANDVHFQADSNYVTSAKFGTSNLNVYLGASLGGEIRTVVYETSFGKRGDAREYDYVDIRTLGIKAAPDQHVYLMTDNEIRAVSYNKSTYRDIRGNVIYGAGFRTTTRSLWMGTDGAMHVVNKGYLEDSSGSPIYRSIFADEIWGYGFVTQSTHAYIGTDDELRVVNKGMTGTYRNVRAAYYYGSVFEFNSSLGGSHIYIRPTSSGEVRITQQGSTSNYRPIRASSFPTASLAEYKQDIKVWEGSALDIINSATIYDYMLNSDVESGKLRRRYGLVIGEGYNTPSEVIDGDGVEQYLMNSISWKAIQELSSVFNKHDDEINYLKLEVQLLRQKVKQLEEMIA